MTNGPNIFTIYKEHIQTIRNGNGNLGYSNHMLSTGHTCGGINDTINMINIEKKKTHIYIYTLEKYHI